jgi:hypothetical protein
MLLQVKLGTPLLDTPLAKEISVSMFLSTDVTVAHASTKVQPVTKNEIFHTLDAHVAQWVVLCPSKLTAYIVVEVLLKRFRADDVFVVTPVGKR